MIKPDEKDILRHACLSVCALRHPTALSANQIRNRAAQEVDFEFTLNDAASACEALASLKYLERLNPGEIGPVSYYQATASGLNYHDSDANPHRKRD